MKKPNSIFAAKCLLACKYRGIAAMLTLLWLFSLPDVQAQGGACSGISYSFEHYEPCKFRARYTNSSECFIEIRYLLESGEFLTWSVNSAAGFTADQISPSEIWIHHNQGFVPLGNQVPLLFTLPPDLNTTMYIAYLDDCAQVGCEIFGGIPIESCPDPQDASIGGVKYRECGSLPYINQTVIPDWTVQLLDVDGNVIGEQVTDADGQYRFYDLPYGVYRIKELPAPGWTPKVPATGEYVVDLGPSEQATRNFGNCPSCSCDDIYMDVVQLPVTSDTCSYGLDVTNDGAYCFSEIHISLASGTFASVTPEAGWEVMTVDSQHIIVKSGQAHISCCHNYKPCYFRVQGASVHEITVSTSYNVGMGNVNCSRAFSYPCPPPVSPAPCCPSGSTYGNELVKNGNFELGNQDFTNDYTYFNPGSPTMIGKYSVLNSGQVYTANNQWACTDHTAFSSTGLMLIVDGYGGPVAWEQQVSVIAGKQYAFSAWFNNLVRPPKNYDDPQMALFVDNTQVAGPLNLPEMIDRWEWLCGTWTATTTGTVTLSIRMLATTSIGNDVGIDDISFRECIPPPPCQVGITVTQNADCTVTVCAVTTGPQPVSYQWCDGRTDACFTTAQTPCVPTTYCVTATCADGSTSSDITVFTLQDITPPVAVCNLGIGVDLGANCNFQVTTAFVDGGSTDNCGIQSMSVSPSTLAACTNTIVTLTVTDWCGNTSTCTMGIQTIEGVPPVMTCPPNTTISGFIDALGNCVAVFQPGQVVAIDNCDPSPTVTNNAPAMLQQGQNSIIWTATDDCGNQTTCEQIVTVQCSCNCQQTSFGFTHNGVFQPVSCNNPAQNPTYGCPVSDVTLTGALGCVQPDGTQCPQSAVSWTLYGPGGFVNQGTMPGPAVNLTFPAASISAPGIYTVSLQTLCQGQTDSCYCTLYWFQQPCDDPCIEDFETGGTGQWATLNGMLSVITDPFTGSMVLKGNDDNGASWMYNNSSAYSGDWTQKFNNCLCFDIRYDNGNPSNPATGTSALTIYQGSGPLSFTKRAIFVVNTPIGNAWTRVCVPVGLSNGTTYPSNQYGQWTSTSLADFDMVMQGVSGIGIPLDFAGGSNPSEMVFVDNFCVEQCADTCCADPSTFNSLVAQGFTTVLQNCKLTVTAPQFDSCYFFSTPPYIVGGPPVPQVVVSATGSWMFNFTQSGTYTICANVFDDCNFQLMCTTVTVDCDTCYCGAFSNLFARPIQGAPSIPLTCGGPVVHFPCPPAGAGIPITGKFECQGNNCPATSQVNWALTQPNGNVINGTVVAGPYFFLPIMPLQYAQPGVYMLVLQGNCGGTDCPPCVIKFTVDCPNPCPCDVQQFQKDVDKGFATALWATSCKACFSPIALDGCDMVEWKVNGTTVGMTNGGQSYCHTFPGAGTYTVTMIVTRKKSDGSLCEVFTYSKTVTVTCILKDVCNDSAFPNQTFGQGAVAGGLNSGGASAGWKGLYGDPTVLEGDPAGTLDGWTMQLSGHADSADVLSNDTSRCLEKGSGILLIRGTPINVSRSNIIANTDRAMAVFLNRGDSYVFNVFNPESCYHIATLDMTAYDTSWFDLEIPYDLSDWAALDTCGDMPHGVLVKPIVYAFTCFESSQGDETSNKVAIDHLCFDQRLVFTEDPVWRKVLRIFPNPNPGTFTVELPEPAKLGTRFRVTDLAGRTVLEQETDSGMTQQTVRAGTLPNGLYFLQVMAEGKVLAVEKFVKQ